MSDAGFQHTRDLVQAYEKPSTTNRTAAQAMSLPAMN